MIFSSLQFLFLFLPAVLCAYLLLFRRVMRGGHRGLWLHLSHLFLLFASLLFYFIGEQFLVWIVIASTLIDYICGLIISGGWRREGPVTLAEGGHRTRLQRAGLCLSICSNLAFLGFFKYFNFGVDSFNRLVTLIGLDSLALHNVMQVTLPLGISFYTFQSMSYTIDVYRGKATATRNLIDFACYVTMFPQLVAGPIIRYRDIAGQLAGRTITVEGFASGAGRFIFGLGKKVLIANTVAVAADGIFGLPLQDVTPSLAWLAVVAYTLQIYFDFSGYSDMAIGLGRMLGFNYAENFNYPYTASSMRDFWRRWHISLSSWFRDYLYIPLGGNRLTSGRTMLNLVTVFFLCGLWHGAEWSFVIWGLYHGFFLAVERSRFVAERLKRRKPLAHVYALSVILAGWVIFRAESFHQAAVFLKAMAGIGPGGVTAYGPGRYLTGDVAAAIIAGMIFATPVWPRLRGAWARITGSERRSRHAAWALLTEGIRLIGLAVLMVLSVMCLAAGTYNPFIYFRF